MLPHSELKSILNTISEIKKIHNEIVQKNQKHNKNPHDKFYTKPEVVKELLRYIPDLNKYDLILDPAAGSGAFFNQLPKSSRLGMDISPHKDSHADIFKKDFLTTKPSEITNSHKIKNPNILTITNPPFGRNSSLVLKFFKHAALFSNTIAFIMPNSFKKESMQRKIPLNFKLKTSVEIPKNSFILNDKPHNVPCVFQIWEKSKTLRQVHNFIFPDHLKKIFEFTSQENADLALTRVGHTAGTMHEKPKEYNKSSHYFIKAKNPKNILEASKKIQYDQDNTVGPRSISKKEFITKIQAYL